MSKNKQIVETFECPKLGHTVNVTFIQKKDNVGELMQFAMCDDAKKCGVGKRSFLFRYDYDWSECAHSGARQLDKIWNFIDSRDYTGLVRALNTKDWERASDALFSMGDDEDVIRALIYDFDDEYWEKAKTVLVKLGKAAIPHLQGALRANKNNSRWGPVFIDALTEIGDPSAIAPFTSFITDTEVDEYIRGELIHAITKMRIRYYNGPILKVLKSDINRDLRATAIYYFSKFPNNDAIEPLIDALFAPPDQRGGARPDLHSSAVWALKAHGDKFKDEVLTTMFKRLKSGRYLSEDTKELFLQVLESQELYNESFLNGVSLQEDGELAFKIAQKVLKSHVANSKNDKPDDSPIKQDPIAIVKQGANAIAKWRKLNPEGNLDLRNADFRNFNLSNLDLSGANLSNAKISGINLSGTNFDGAVLTYADIRNSNLSHSNLRNATLDHVDLSGANLQEADLSEASAVKVSFKNADLTTANFQNADLTKARFNTTIMSGANLSGAQCGGAVFNNIDLSEVVGLEDARCSSIAYIERGTATRSKGKIPAKFLETAFYPQEYIDSIQALGEGKTTGKPSCFISYASQDEALARKLYNDLKKNGVICWFAPEDMKIGDEIRPTIEQTIKEHDKLLLVLSRYAVLSKWVKMEVETAFQQEEQTNEKVLLPIYIDEMILDTDQSWAADIRSKRHIGDFCGWENSDNYDKYFKRLLSEFKLN